MLALTKRNCSENPIIDHHTLGKRRSDFYLGLPRSFAVLTLVPDNMQSSCSKISSKLLQSDLKLIQRVQPRNFLTSVVPYVNRYFTEIDASCGKP